MRWKGNHHKAGLSEGYCSELLEGAPVVSSRRFAFRRRRRPRSSRRMNRRRGSWYCDRCTRKNQQQLAGHRQQQQQQQQQPWRGESFSHLGALVRGPITLFATYDVIRGGH